MPRDVLECRQRRCRHPSEAPAAGGSGDAILQVRDLSVAYETDAGPVPAVDRVDLDLAPTEFLAIVGEVGLRQVDAAVRHRSLLSPPALITGGTIVFKGRNMVRLTDTELRDVRWSEFSVVMQSAMNALNPVKSVAAQMIDVCRAHTTMSRPEIRKRSERSCASCRSTPCTSTVTRTSCPVACGNGR